MRSTRCCALCIVGMITRPSCRFADEVEFLGDSVSGPSPNVNCCCQVSATPLRRPSETLTVFRDCKWIEMISFANPKILYTTQTTCLGVR
eukprot:scaffold7095_cov260-Pinguiococcus_pyrenoidosus.AAC.29